MGEDAIDLEAGDLGLINLQPLHVAAASSATVSRLVKAFIVHAYGGKQRCFTCTHRPHMQFASGWMMHMMHLHSVWGQAPQ